MTDTQHKNKTAAVFYINFLLSNVTYIDLSLSMPIYSNILIMKQSTNSHTLSLDDDDDVELEELFGFRAKIERTTTSSISNNAATVIKANNNISGSKLRVTFDSWKENMEEDIRQNNDTDGNQFINIEPAAKIIRLDEITDADVDDLEEQLFQKYSAVEDIPDDMDVELEPKEKSGGNNDEDEEEGEENYYDVYEADEEEEGMLQYIYL